MYANLNTIFYEFIMVEEIFDSPKPQDSSVHP